MGWEDNRLDMGLGAWGAETGRILCRRIRQGARSASRQPLPRRTLERPGAEPPLRDQVFVDQGPSVPGPDPGFGAGSPWVTTGSWLSRLSYP